LKILNEFQYSKFNFLKKGQRHIQEIQQKLEILRAEKEALKKKKTEFQEYVELKRKVADYSEREEELAKQKDERAGKEEGMKEEIEKIKKNIEE
jgi:chromosome segregation ATPase